MYPVNTPIMRLLKTVKNIFLSGALRISLVLMLLVSCYTCIAVTGTLFTSLPYALTVEVVVLNVAIASHHWYGMTKHETLKDKPRFGSLVDFILTTFECTAVLYFIRPWSWPTIDRYSMSAYIIFLCAVWFQTVCLCILLMIRFAVMATRAIDKRSEVLTNGFNFFAMTNESSKSPIYGLVSGFSVSHDRHWFVFFLRNSFTIVIVLSLLAFLFTNLVLEPIQETGMAPQKLYTTAVSTELDSEFWNNVNWSIVAFVRNNTFSEESKLHDAIQVKALWSNEPDTTDTPCTVSNFKPRDSDSTMNYIEMVVFNCPLIPTLDSDPFADAWPDLLITVNFTNLGINATSLSNYRSRTVSIVVGMYNDPLEVIRSTLPIPLVPDAHLLGGVSQTVREQFKKPVLASLGVFSSTKKYFTITVPSLMPDPSLQVPRDNNTATLRLYVQDDDSDWHFFVEYREKSVLDGISAVGGFWTVVNGVFATIFGTTLLWVAFGVKPLSTFGLIHKIPKFYPVLDNDPGQGRYRNLLSESQSDQGLLDYVRDHFVDLQPFQSNQAVSEKSKSGTTSPVQIESESK